MTKENNGGIFSSAGEDVISADLFVKNAKTQSSSYKLAYTAEDFTFW